MSALASYIDQNLQTTMGNFNAQTAPVRQQILKLAGNCADHNKVRYRFFIKAFKDWLLALKKRKTDGEGGEGSGSGQHGKLFWSFLEGTVPVREEVCKNVYGKSENLPEYRACMFHSEQKGDLPQVQQFYVPDNSSEETDAEISQWIDEALKDFKEQQAQTNGLNK